MLKQESYLLQKAGHYEYVQVSQLEALIDQGQKCTSIYPKHKDFINIQILRDIEILRRELKRARGVDFLHDYAE